MILKSLCESCEPCFVTSCKTPNIVLFLSDLPLTVVIGLSPWTIFATASRVRVCLLTLRVDSIRF